MDCVIPFLVVVGDTEGNGVMKEFLTFFRYQNKAGKLYKWMLLIALTAFSFTCAYIRTFFNEYYVGLCAKDMLVFFSRDGIILAMTGGISTIRGLLFTYVDDNPNVIVRYNSKMKVFVYQSMSLLIITLIDMVVLYAVGIISAYIILGVYDNWHIDGSLFYNTVTRKGFSADIGVYEAVIYIVFILRKTVIVWCAGIISLLVEYITDWIRVAILATVFIYGVSITTHFSISRLDLRILDIYNMLKTVMYTALIALAGILFVIAGTVLSRRRQYYR